MASHRHRPARLKPPRSARTRNFHSRPRGYQSNWLTLNIGGRNYGVSRYRLYDPDLGIFLSRDFLPYRNKYRTWSNNPVKKIDNNGLGDADEGKPKAEILTDLELNSLLYPEITSADQAVDEEKKGLQEKADQYTATVQAGKADETALAQLADIQAEVDKAEAALDRVVAASFKGTPVPQANITPEKGFHFQYSIEGLSSFRRYIQFVSINLSLFDKNGVLVYSSTVKKVDDVVSISPEKRSGQDIHAVDVQDVVDQLREKGLQLPCKWEASWKGTWYAVKKKKGKGQDIVWGSYSINSKLPGYDGSIRPFQSETPFGGDEHSAQREGAKKLKSTEHNAAGTVDNDWKVKVNNPTPDAREYR